MLEKEAIAKAVEEALKGKGARKFRQSIDIAVNFKDVDFNKPEERINADVPLVHPFKEIKVAVFADGQMALDAGKVADLVIASAQIQSYVDDKKKQKELLNYSLLAVPQLMAVIGKSLGQVLGTKGKLPKPVLPNANLKQLVDSTKRTVNLKSKGKYLPSLHCVIGNEDMPKEQVVDNIQAVIEALLKKVSENQIASVYVKLTMGKPVKVG